MRNGSLVLSNVSLARFLSPSAIVATTTPALRVSSTDGAMIGTATTVLLRSDRVSRLPPIRTAARPALSTGTRAQLALGGLVATRGLPPAPAPEPPPDLPSGGETLPSDSRRAASAPRDRQSAAGAGAELTLPAGSDGPANQPQGVSEAVTTAAKPGKPAPIEMTIDSLQNYDLLQPIPVVIEALGDRLFSAQAPSLEISTTGSSIGGAFLQLKEQIAATYEQCRQKNTVTPERLHQLGLFQAYIGKAKRGWSLGRG